VWILPKNQTKWFYCVTEGTQPAPRSKHSSISLPWGSLLVFGGESEEGILNDLWLLDYKYSSVSNLSVNGKWSRLVTDHQPSPRYGHRALFSNAYWGHKMILFGGETRIENKKETLDDTWILDIVDLKQPKWTILNKPGPPCRHFHSMEISPDTEEPKILLFGGGYRNYINGESQIFWRCDLWLFDLQNLIWSEINIPLGLPQPKPRDGHTAAWIDGDRMLILGGWIGQKKLNQALQSLQDSITSGSNLAPGLLFLNTLDDTHFSDDLWEFTFSSMKWRELSLLQKPKPCGHWGSVWMEDRKGRRMLLVTGGESFPPSIKSEVWKLYQI